MKLLTATEVEEWLAAFPSGGEYVGSDGNKPFFTTPDASCIDLEFPQKLERLPFFARMLATLGYDDSDWDGALFWFTAWDVWNRRDEGIGYRMVEAMHRAAGQPASFEAAPGHQFRADELTEACGLLLQPMIFGWDAFYLPRWSYGTDQFFLHVSHDSFVTIATRTKEFYERAFTRLKEADLNPVPGHDMRKQRFCRGS